MKFGSLFTGIGGFDLGFIRAGMEPAWMCEYDTHAQLQLNKNFGDIPIYQDVRILNGKEVASIDVLCGGFPCQDVSVAGRRAGLDGERSGLWFEFHRIINEAKPAWVVIENVPGLLSSNGGRDFAVILRGLADSGYGVAYRILDSQYFGVPQRRRRVFIVGHLRDGRAAKVLFESGSLQGDFEKMQKKGRNAPTLTSNGAGTNRPAGQGNEHEFCITSCDYHNIEIKDNRNVVAIDTRNNRTIEDISGTLQSKTNGGYSLNYINPIGITVKDEDVSPTLRASSGGENGMGRNPYAIHGTEVRRLTPIECERLQGFPDGWTSGQSDTQRYKQLGNAVTVNVAQWIGERIIKNQ